MFAWMRRRLKPPSLMTTERQSLELIADADRFARLDERARVREDVRLLVEYYEAQIRAFRRESVR